jgi:two-component system chemotaxis response regulator CheB
VQEDDAHQIFRILEAGAVDVFPKPTAGLVANDRTFSQLLVNKIQVLAGVKVFKKRKSLVQIERSNPRLPESSLPSLGSRFKIVAIGASTGGPMALQQFFSVLPADFPLPIICVQHISFGFLQGLIDWLSLSCALPIQIAQAGEQPCSGKIYFPVEQQHLELDTKRRFVSTDSPLVDGHRPSITATFRSISRIYGRKAIAILLTGMGRDGATGLLEINRVGGLTIAQDEATSVVFGMPQEAIKLGAVNQVLPIQEIAPALLKLLEEQRQNAIVR